MRAVLLVCVVVTAACGDNLKGNISIDPGRYEFVIGELVAMTPYTGLTLGTGGDYQIAIVDDDPNLPAEAYRVDEDAPQHWRVHAHDVLGAQYGVADALENLGFRFRHPFDTYAPAVPQDAATELGVTHQPQIALRGLHLHTLHPIEGYFAFDEPSPGSTNDAHRIINWTIMNRGNLLQWVALDNITEPNAHTKWQAFTREIIDYAHARGIKVGLNIQLFGQTSYQNSFVLSTDKSGTVPIATEIATNLPLVTTDLPFDIYDLSFGEFLTTDPVKFVTAVNEVRAQLRTLAPQAEMHGVIHVGASLTVNYMGQDVNYYHLVQFADPSIIPEIHSVMFYNLFEDAGGAYGLQDFSDNRAYLIDQRMCNGLPGAYQPETAYWITFDDSVPQMLPLYVRSRWTDLHEIAARGCGQLYEHVLFTSGWEWGFWLHDVTAMRASYELTEAPQNGLLDQLAPDLGKDGGALVAQLADVQHDALIDDRLAAYIAGRDIALDFARQLNGVVSEPERITFEDLVANGGTAAFSSDVLAPLDAYAQKLDDLAAKYGALDLPESRWTAEFGDGFEIDRLRAHFISETYRSVIARIAGNDGHHELAIAQGLLDQAKEVVARRHADLHDTHRGRLFAHDPNLTSYAYGYLYNADTLCYWNREIVQVQAILGDTTTTPPPCLY